MIADDAEFQTFLEAMPDAVLVSDGSGEILSLNNRLEAMFGFEREELKHRDAGVLFARRARRSDSMDALASAKPFRWNGRTPVRQFTGLKKNGTEFPVELSISTPKRTSETLTIVSIRDLTRRRARKSSELTDGGLESGKPINGHRRDIDVGLITFESESSSRLLIQRVKDYAILRLDVEGRVSSWNEGAERIKGYRPEEIIGKHFSAFYPPEDIASGKPWRELEIAVRDGRFEDEGLRLRKDGSSFLANVIITPLRDSKGTLQGYCKITRDTTERQRHLTEMADALKRSEETDVERLKQMNLKDQFLSHVSHELRSPLASIHSFTNILVDGLAGETNPKQDQYLAIILKNVRQLQAMIEDLLEVTKAQTGILSFESQATSVIEAAVYAIETLRSAAAAKSIEVSLQTAPDLPLAYADLTRLRQVLTILLDNAIKFTPAQGQVSVKVSPFELGKECVLVEIIDTGCGMTREASERIFERLYQATDRDEGGRRGLGLGLYIARELVMRMGGRIWVESEPQEGSHFFLTIPFFSLEVLVSSVLLQTPKEGSGTLLLNVQVTPMDASLVVSENGLKEVRKVLRDCLRRDADVLLPAISRSHLPELVFVVSLVRLDSVGVVRERILSALGRNATLREEGLQFSVSHARLTSKRDESAAAADNYLSRVSAEIQFRVDGLCESRSQIHGQ